MSVHSRALKSFKYQVGHIIADTARMQCSLLKWNINRNTRLDKKIRGNYTKYTTIKGIISKFFDLRIYTEKELPWTTSLKIS